MMPTPVTFVVFSFLLRTTEGIGTAMFNTASYTLLTHLYAKNKGMIVVRLHRSTSHMKGKSNYCSLVTEYNYVVYCDVGNPACMFLHSLRYRRTML